MVEMNFDGEDAITCEGCGTEIPAFLDGCPYCDSEQLEETLPCPSCGIEIHEDSEKCPLCGAWVSMAVPTRSAAGRRAMIVILVLIVVGMLLALVVR